MLRTLIARIRGAVLNRRMEDEFASEIETHLALLEDELVRRGMARDLARSEARRQFGGVTQARELHREGRGLAQLERLWADLAYALRMMRRNPGFTLVAVATLALGIGVNTALFSAYNAVALKPWPIADPERVVRLERWFESRNLGDIQYAFSYPEYVYLRGHATGFAGLAAASWPVRAFGEARGGTAMEKLQGQLVSANYFAAMGVGARLGRTFVEGEDRTPGANPVIVLSHAAWQRWFQGDVAVGQTVQLNGTAFTVIGIMPEAFTGTSAIPVVPDFWAPVSMQGPLAPGSNWLDTQEVHLLQILGRLKNGAPLGSIQAEATLLLQQFGATHKELDKTVRLTLQRTSYFGNVDDPRFQAFVAGVMLVVGLVLFVACANIANLLLARTAVRQREIAVRLALGAGRGRVIRQLLTESVVLALVGGAAGLLLAAWCSRVLWVAIEQVIAGPFAGNFKLVLDLRPDVRVYAYALLISTASGMLFGLWPALRATRTDLIAATRDESTGFGAGWTRSRLRGWLVGGQVAVSMLLLITAGLLTRGLVRSRAADPGFETRGLYMLTGDFGNDPAKAASRQRRVMERLRTAPEVSGVAVGGVPMLGTWTPPMMAGQARGRTLASYADQDYLTTMGIPLVRGRGFSKAEVERSAPVAVISEAAARRYWPAEDPLGKRFQLDLDFRGAMAEFEVIGVAKDVRYGSLTRIDLAHVYLTPKAGDFQIALLRTRGDARQALADVRAAVRSVDADVLPSLSVISIEAGPLFFQKVQSQAGAAIAAVLAALALLLAGVGIYGVMAYLVSQRTREIGIRMALGAAAGAVVRGVVLSGLRPVFVGMAVGIAAAAGASAVLHSTLSFPGSADLLYGVSFYDPATFLGLSVFLLAVAALASVVPARRAVRVDPMVALRYE
jgi:macrolide transport system ATP-binding/permease protein